MSPPEGYVVEGHIVWNTDAEYEVGRELAKALDDAEFSLLVDEANDRHLLVTAPEGE